LCPHCKRPESFGEQDEEAWNTLVAPWKSNRPAVLNRPVGCLECRMTGYTGRVGIYETLLMSTEMKKLLTRDVDLTRLREQASRDGMKPLRISGVMKVAAGLTTAEEILKVAPLGGGI
jgi:general secretion pathway protein E